jgi:hypothetical protein
MKKTLESIILKNSDLKQYQLNVITFEPLTTEMISCHNCNTKTLIVTAKHSLKYKI